MRAVDTTSAPSATSTRGRGADAVTAAIAVALYAGIVIWGAMHHEPWRDEVVPLSIARAAHSPAALVEALRFEGHPMLWYVLLALGWAVVGQTWVLKGASVAAAIGAILLVQRSPLPWWVRWLFPFSFYPLYQYSVVSRGYSLEMLLLFGFCAVYPQRHRHPLALALVLAALANVEALGFLIAIGAAALLAVDAYVGTAAIRRPVSRVLPAMLVYLGGLLLAVWTAFPAATHPLGAFPRGDLTVVALGVGRALLQPVGHFAPVAILPAASLWLWAYFAYLLPRPAVLAFAVVSFVGIEAFFNVVYGPGALWHLGNPMLVLIAVLWLDASEPDAAGVAAAFIRPRLWLGRVLAAGLIVLLADQIAFAVNELRIDFAHDYSANRRLGALLREDPTLAGAVVMGEPEPPLWSLPYYAENRIYLTRESRYRSWGTFSPARLRASDLAGLLAAAERVRTACACPVVLALGWQLDALGTFTNAPGTYAEETFTIEGSARDQFLAATRKLASLGPTITDENYDVYVVR